jgi:hypothetical protein
MLLLGALHHEAMRVAIATFFILYCSDPGEGVERRQRRRDGSKETR